MPEHRAGTPSRLRELESFLWNDFNTGMADWQVWVARRLPGTSAEEAGEVFAQAMRLHGALRSLQAANSGIQTDDEGAGREVLNDLIAHYAVHPRLGEDGALSLTSNTVLVSTTALVSITAADSVARLLLLALEALQSGVWRRFKLCREPTCRASYYDASRAAVKIWCSMETCGSRHKMRRYRAL
jgi:predicted RNA-binding Zn ribbon-like protein